MREREELRYATSAQEEMRPTKITLCFQFSIMFVLFLPFQILKACWHAVNILVKNRNGALLENSAGVKSNANFKVNITVACASKTKNKN